MEQTKLVKSKKSDLFCKCKQIFVLACSIVFLFVDNF